MIQMSASILNIGPKLLELQAQLKVVEKSETNPHFRNRYAPLDACVKEVMPKANALGLVLLQAAVPSPHPGEVSVCTQILHAESGEWMAATMVCSPKDLTPQSVGGAITYGRRYGLSMFGLLTDEDVDGEEGRKHTGAATATHNPAPAPATNRATGQPPAQEVSSDEHHGILEKVDVKTGQSAKGPWTKYAAFIDGSWYSTFDGKVGDILRDLEGQPVTFTYKEAGAFKTLLSVALELAPF